MVRTKAIVLVVSLVVALFAVICSTSSWNRISATGWHSLDYVQRVANKDPRRKVLVCVYAHWDVATYRHYAWLSENLASIVSETDLIPCAISLDDLSNDEKLADTFSNIFPRLPPQTSGFGLVNLQTRQSEWYYAVDSKEQFASILRNSIIFGPSGIIVGDGSPKD
jgi:hypothetical protein